MTSYFDVIGLICRKREKKMKKQILALMSLVLLLNTTMIIADDLDPMTTEVVEQNDEGPPIEVIEELTIEANEEGVMVIDNSYHIKEGGRLILENAKLLLKAEIVLDGGVLVMQVIIIDDTSTCSITIKNGVIETDDLVDHLTIDGTHIHHSIDEDLDKHHFGDSYLKLFNSGTLKENDNISILKGEAALNDIDHGIWLNKQEGAALFIRGKDVLEESHRHLTNDIGDMELDVGNTLSKDLMIDGHKISNLEVLLNENKEVLELKLDGNTLGIKAISPGTSYFILRGTLEKEVLTRAPSDELRVLFVGSAKVKDIPVTTPPETPPPTPTPTPPPTSPPEIPEEPEETPPPPDHPPVIVKTSAK